ncbi:MAG: glycosyltransferase family 4 protein [Nitrososphaerota archaeon]|nr:glycosyltransferase family 4 protein [Nitrososphaerota archaeon]
MAYQSNGGRLHSQVGSIFSYPPEGYRFIISKGAVDLLLSPFVESDFWYFKVMAPVLRRSAQGEYKIPANYIQRKIEHSLHLGRKVGDLVYSWNHLVFEDHTPWVVDLEYVWALMGYNETYTRMFGSVIRQRLEASSCKAILCYTELAARQIADTFGEGRIASKIRVVRRAVPPKVFTRDYSNNKPVVLFLGTRNEPNAFDSKGGKEAVQAFIRARKMNPNMSMIVRSDIPPRLKPLYRQTDGVTVLSNRLTSKQLENLLRSVDMVLLPCHVTPSMAFIEAMSYGLPVITTNEHANGEIIRDSEDGIVVPCPRGIPTFQDVVNGKSTMLNWEKKLAELQEDSVAALTDALLRLASDATLRKRLGQSGKAEVDRGRHSIVVRNAHLKSIFDDAIGSGN